MSEIAGSILPEVIIINPRVFKDDRGYFFESFQQKRYQEMGVDKSFVQDNCSHSAQNTLRGLHYQLKHAQGKLVCVTAGTVYDVIVDIRKGSPRFGQWMGLVLDAEKCTQVYIPPGFAHGFCVLSETANFFYKCTDYYTPGDEYGVAWDDAKLGIKWPLSGEPVLSPKDKEYLPLHQIEDAHLPRYIAL